MHDETHGPIQALVLGEGTVAALMSQDPDASKDEALNGGVGDPSSGSQVDGGQHRNVGDGEVDQSTEVEEVAGHICH